MEERLQQRIQKDRYLPESTVGSPRRRPPVGEGQRNSPMMLQRKATTRKFAATEK